MQVDAEIAALFQLVAFSTVPRSEQWHELLSDVSATDELEHQQLSHDRTALRAIYRAAVRCT